MDMNETIIKAVNLEKQYMKQKAVKNASFEIKEGMICGLIGPNGAGKTTIMKMLGGLILPTGGEISIYGGKSEKELAAARKRTSFMIEIPYLKEGMTAYENLEKQRLQKGIPDKKRIDEVLEIVGLSNVGNKPVRKFSLGMKQRLGIATALLTKPELMVLDEPVNGLDPEGIIEIRKLLLKLNREEHITIIISSHILSELSLLCTDYIFINKGEIIQKVSADELKVICKEHYVIDTDNNSLAAAILSDKLGISSFSVEKDGTIRLYERLDEIRLVSKTLFENGVVPTTLAMHEANLEEYYIDLAGEENDKSDSLT